MLEKMSQSFIKSLNTLRSTIKEEGGQPTPSRTSVKHRKEASAPLGICDLTLGLR